MANYGIKQFNYQNVESYRGSLEQNRNKMNDLYNKYKTELTNIETNWMGQSGRVSQSDMQELITSYNGFLNKVDSFINMLAESQRRFVETENENAATYR